MPRVQTSLCRAAFTIVSITTGWLALTASDCTGPTTGTFNPADTVVQCSGDAVPAGFIKVNDDWDPTKCGNPSSITRNVSTYQRYDNRPVGTTLTVCASAAAPSGWADGTVSWDPNKCGHPSSNTSKNIKLITRNS